MKKIYIVLTHTGTLLSKLVKKYTKYDFSHVSIALDIELKEMYSFGRLRPSNPFFAGFVHEYIDKGTFKRFYNTTAKIYSLEVTEEQYNKISRIIENFKNEKDEYTFNIIGLFAAGFHKKIGKDHSFYCAEFVKYVMDNAGIETNLPKIIKPGDFKEIDDLQVIYSGLLRKYNSSKVDVKELLRNNLLYPKKEGII
ncbi:MAG: hypothetical protein HFJ45_00775 [Clostridia bacterium]|nr:hypothetical protein [Clostridia bacterium]